jgi:nucleoside-diphosphate-sugar epimerase
MMILITGATGFVGRHLVARVAERHEVVALGRRTPLQPLPLQVEIRLMDLDRPIDVTRLPAKCDVIIHLAFAGGHFPDDAARTFAVHTGAAHQLLEYGRRAGASHFILASTGDVYGPATQGPVAETETPRPESFYAVTKYAAELITGAYRDLLVPCVLRLYQPYGPGQTDRLIPRLAEAIRAGRPIHTYAGHHPLVSPTYIDDVARAFDAVVARRLRGVYNLAGRDIVSLRDLADMIGRRLGMAPVFEEHVSPQGDLAGNGTALWQTLDLEPATPLEQGLRLTFG